MAWIAPLVMAGGSLLGGALSANASNSAAGSEVQAADDAANAQLSMYRQTRADLTPYMASGNGALNSLNSLLGITPVQPTNTPLAFAGPAPSSPGRSRSATFADPFNLFGGALNGLAPGQPTEHIDPLQGALWKKLGWYAQGGPIRPAPKGQDVVVGEEGPEILHMDPGSTGYVHPNPATVARMQGRAYGGPVGARSGDPIAFPRSPITPVHQIGFPGVPYRPMGFMPMGYSGPIRMPGYGMIQARAGGGPVGQFDPTAGNNTPLPGSGQTPAQIMQQAPQYQFVEQQGLEGLDNSAAASGGLLSGGHLAGILNYSQGLASQQFQNIYNNLAGVASLGESAGSMTGQAGSYAAMGAGNAYQSAGQAAAAGTIGSANAYSSSLGNLGFMYAMNPGMFGGTSSDRRLKEDIVSVGRTHAGLPLYSYKYKGGPAYHVGVMADEAAQMFPEAVRKDPLGFLMVDYNKIH